jgi:hypothetical protein
VRSRNLPWTKEDNERLKGFVAQGAFHAAKTYSRSRSEER